MKRRARAPLLAAALACGAALAGQPGEPEYYVEDLRCVGGKHSLTLPATLPALLALGPGARVEDLDVERNLDGESLTRKRIRFDGLTFTLIAYGRDLSRYSLQTVEIRSAAWARIAPFAVGESVAGVRKRLGSIADADGELRSTYSGENESLRFETASGKVTAILYACYTG